MKPRSCVICGALGTTRWTLTNNEVASVADLCGAHSAPLEEIVSIAGTSPPDAEPEPQWTVPTIVQRTPRKSSFEPLNWKPSD